MAEGRRRDRWAHTAALVAAVINAGNAWPSAWSQAWGGAGIEPVEADEVNPYACGAFQAASRPLNPYQPARMARMQAQLDAKRAGQRMSGLGNRHDANGMS